MGNAVGCGIKAGKDLGYRAVRGLSRGKTEAKGEFVRCLLERETSEKRRDWLESGWEFSVGDLEQ